MGTTTVRMIGSISILLLYHTDRCRIEEPVRRLWELVDERWLYVRACAITALVELGQQAAEPLVEQALREALESDASRMCIWPLIQLMSRQPNLVGAETRDLFRKRQSSFGEP